VGVIKILEASGIPIDMVLGTSMGSPIGGLYAAGYSPEEMEEIVTTQDWQTVFMDRKNSPRDGYDQEKRRRFALALGFDKDGIRLGEGLLEGQNVLSLFTELTLHLLGTRNFDDFPVPYRSVAAEVLTGDKVVFSSGSLAEAMRASMSIPAVFKPYTVEGKRLIDGGIVDNIRGYRAQDGSRYCHRRGFPRRSAEERGRVEVGFRHRGTNRRSFHRANMKPSRSGADILIVPDLSGYTTASYDEAVGIVERGTLGAIARLMDIEKLAEKISQSRPLVSPESQANRKARRDPPPLSSFVVEGGSENDKLFVLGLFDPMAGQKRTLSVSALRSTPPTLQGDSTS
jgi:NTE family protein